MGVIPVRSSHNLIGLTVKLDRPVDRERLCIIEAARAPHAGELVFAVGTPITERPPRADPYLQPSRVGCNRRRGWLSKTTATWIEKVIAHFGAPTTPIVLRKLHMFE